MQTGLPSSHCGGKCNVHSLRSISSATLADLFFFKKFLADTHVLFWGHWYPCFGFLVMSPLGFKARVGSALFAIFAEANVMYIPQDSPLVLHLPTSWQPVHSRSLPHMHVQRWDLARFRMCNRTNRRRTRYHCASDPATLADLFDIKLTASLVHIPLPT